MLFWDQSNFLSANKYYKMRTGNAKTILISAMELEKNIMSKQDFR